MNPAQWQRARQLFDAVCDLSQSKQEAQLNQCDDSEVLSLVKRMLAGEANERVGDDLASQAPAITEGLSEAIFDQRVGQQLGNYRITQKIGQGGMGDVYQAHRTDGSFKQQVAIKFVAMPSYEQTTRFKRERELLARLSHPNIARLLDGGTDQRGIPYLVMELVDGRQIDRYCDAYRLSIERRLKLFLAVLSAVSAAHRQLIIHRDIKPGNILVDADHQPKLLDFGIGKLLEADEPRLQFTQPLFSPQYVAPEQIQGRPVGTHTDVFQLGLLLDELISGVPVRNIQSESIEAITRAGLRTPEPPADRLAQSELRDRIAAARQAAPRQLLAQLGGDLRWIIYKACAMTSDDRYAHVEDLADDIRRFLSGRPISARPPSMPYLVGKFARRHRLAVMAGVLTLSLLVTALAVSIRQTQEAEHQRETAQQQRLLAQQEATKQQQVKDFLLDVFRDVDPAVTLGEAVTAKSLLDQAASRIRDVRYDPEMEAALNRTIGGAYLGLGLLKPAEHHLSLAMRGFQALDRAPSKDYADALFALAELHSARVDDEARRFYEAALTVREDLYPNGSIELAHSLLGSARANRLHNNRATSVAMYRRALTVIEQQEGQQSRHYADALGQLASFYGSLGEFANGLPVAQQAVRIARGHLDPRDPLLASLVSLLGTLQSDSGQFDAAAGHLSQALALYAAIFPEHHPKVLITRANLASLHLNVGHFGPAITLAQDHYEGVIHTFGPISAKAVFALDLIGEVHYGAGEFRRALAAHEEAMALLRELDQQSTASRRTRFFRGRSLLRLHQFEAAIAALSSVVNEQPRVADAFQIPATVRLAEATLSAGETKAALELADQARAAAVALPIVEQADAAIIWARCLIANDEQQRAAAVFTRVINDLRDHSLHRAGLLAQRAKQELQRLQSG